MLIEDVIYIWMEEVDGATSLEPTEVIVEEYRRRTPFRFLIEVMPDQNY